MIASLWAGQLSADTAAATAPIKIAVFPFELENFTAAGVQTPNPTDTPALTQATDEARQQLLQSGRYTLIETAAADETAAKNQELRNCNGCEAAIAGKLGADQALLGVITKISMTEYVVNLRVSDVQTGQPLSSYTTGLRMGANYSWSRGVRSLIRNDMLTAQ
jgi:hypothetical protein